jgi:hypothetical protein
VLLHLPVMHILFRTAACEAGYPALLRGDCHVAPSILRYCK